MRGAGATNLPSPVLGCTTCGAAMPVTLQPRPPVACHELPTPHLAQPAQAGVADGFKQQASILQLGGAAQQRLPVEQQLIDVKLGRSACNRSATAAPTWPTAVPSPHTAGSVHARGMCCSRFQIASQLQFHTPGQKDGVAGYRPGPPTAGGVCAQIGRRRPPPLKSTSLLQPCGRPPWRCSWQ